MNKPFFFAKDYILRNRRDCRCEVKMFKEFNGLFNVKGHSQFSNIIYIQIKF